MQIEDGDGGFFILYLGAAGQCIADRWHEPLDEAKTPAKFDFEIVEQNWQDCQWANGWSTDDVSERTVNE